MVFGRCRGEILGSKNLAVIPQYKIYWEKRHSVFFVFAWWNHGGHCDDITMTLTARPNTYTTVSLALVSPIAGSRSHWALQQQQQQASCWFPPFCSMQSCYLTKSLLSFLLHTQRLPLQTSPHWRLRCRKVLSASPICGWHLHRILHFYHWCWFRKQKTTVPFEPANRIVSLRCSRGLFSLCFFLSPCRKSVLSTWMERPLSFRFGTQPDKSASAPLLHRITVVPTVLSWSTTSRITSPLTM